jgi:hypothetical protein
MATQAQRAIERDAKIVATRVANGGRSGVVCPICCRPVGTPYRVYDDHGKVSVGCIDASHTASLAGQVSESARWHFRKVARAMRAELK